MIHLRAQHWSSLGDDTFWAWAARDFPNAVRADTQPVGPADHVLHYGLIGAPPSDPDRSVALLWEQHPEMQREVAKLCRRDFKPELAKLNAAAKACARRTVASHTLVADYKQHGPVDVLPIGVDTDLWKPPEGDEKVEIRKRNRIPLDKNVGFWAGWNHPMKGYDLFVRYAADHPDIWWVVCFKRKRDLKRHGFKGVTVAEIPQPALADLMKACDFALFTSRLRPYVLLEWEAMAANLPVVNIGHPRREFTPGPDPRYDVIDRGWDRPSTKRIWMEYLGI